MWARSSTVSTVSAVRYYLMCGTSITMCTCTRCTLHLAAIRSNARTARWPCSLRVFSRKYKCVLSRSTREGGCVHVGYWFRGCRRVGYRAVCLYAPRVHTHTHSAHVGTTQAKVKTSIFMLVLAPMSSDGQLPKAPHVPRQCAWCVPSSHQRPWSRGLRSRDTAQPGRKRSISITATQR